MRVGPKIARIRADINQHVYSSAGKKKGLCSPGGNEEADGEETHDDNYSLQSNLQTQPVFLVHFEITIAVVVAAHVSKKTERRRRKEGTDLEP